jgi:hypothetical protein
MRTLTGSIARVNFLDRNPSELSFVFDKAVQLEESPAMEIIPLTLAEPYPLADSLEVFKDDPAPGAFSVLYDLFADLVVNTCREALFFLGKVAQYPFGRFGLFSLQAATLSASAVTHSGNDLTAVNIPSAIGSDIDNAGINPEPFVGVKSFWFWQVTSLMDIPFAFAVNQVGFTLRILQQIKLLLTSKERHFQPTSD